MTPIRLAKASITAAEYEAVARVLADGYLGMGRFVAEFEEALRTYLGAEYVVATNTGTSALHLACAAAGIGPGDEVLVPSLTYVASFQAISATGATPVPCEIIPATCALDLDDAAQKVTARTRGIMPIHYGGRPMDLDALDAFARTHGVRVIEDAAHAFGSSWRGAKVGSRGDITCFSFDGIKNITCGEGGALVTTDPEIARHARDARLLGVQRDTERRYLGERSWEFEVTHQGFRYHMSNLNAALGLAQLSRFEKDLKPRRQWLAARYARELASVQKIAFPLGDHTDVVPHIFPIRLLDADRDRVRTELLAAGIEVGVHYYPNHLLAYYGSRNGWLPVTERVYGELLSLPLHPDLTEAEQDSVVSALQEALTR